MLKPAAIALTLFGLAACSDTNDVPLNEPVVVHGQDGTEEPERSPEGTAITELGDLLGEYRVAGIDGASLDGDRGIAVSVDGPLLSFEPVCAGFIWEVNFVGDALELSRFEAPAPVAGLAEVPPPSKPKCLIGLIPEWTQLASAFDSVTRAERTRENGVRLTGQGRSVLLFSQ